MDHGETFRLLLYAVIFLHVRCVRSDVTCSAGNFTLGGPGSVRCNFGEVIQSKHNFNVVRYSGESSDSGDYVLLCNWAGTSLECTVKEGYSFDRKVDCSLTLAIAVVEERMAGMYVCQLVPDHGIPVHTCQLNVTAAIEQSTAAKEQPPSTLTVDPSHEHSSYLTYSISAVAVLLLAVAGFAIGLLVFLSCRNESVRKGIHRDQENQVVKCCCERIAIVFKLPVASANTEPVEEGQALNQAGANTGTGKVHVQTADFGTYVTEDHFKQAKINFSVTFHKPLTFVSTHFADPRLHLPPLTKEQPRPMQPKHEPTTRDGGSNAHKKSTPPPGPTELTEKGEEAQGLLSQNLESTSERPEETERDALVNTDVKDGKQSGSERSDEKSAKPNEKSAKLISLISYISEREAPRANPSPSPGPGPPATH